MKKTSPSAFRPQTSDLRLQTSACIFSQDFYLKILFPSNIRLNSDDD